MSIWGTFLLGVVFRHVICGFYLFFLPVMLPSEIRKLPPDPPVRGFPGVWKLRLLRLPSRDGSPSLTLLSLSLSFIFCPFIYCLLSKTMGCFSGCLMSSASDQKLFCGVCSVLKRSFDEFVGEKVVSLSYSSAILVPPPKATGSIPGWETDSTSHAVWSKKFFLKIEDSTTLAPTFLFLLLLLLSCFSRVRLCATP